MCKAELCSKNVQGLYDNQTDNQSHCLSSNRSILSSHPHLSKTAGTLLIRDELRGSLWQKVLGDPEEHRRHAGGALLEAQRNK